MATSTLTYAGNGTTTDFVFDQGALEAGHLVISVDDVEVTLDVTVTETVKRREFLVEFPVAPESGTTIRIRRVTPVATRVHHYSSSIFDRQTPDESYLHRLYILQEAVDNYSDAVALSDALKAQLQALIPPAFDAVQLSHDTESAARDAQLAQYITDIQLILDGITPNVNAEDTTTAVAGHAAELCYLEYAVNNLKAYFATYLNRVVELENGFPYIFSDPAFPLVGYWPLHELVDGDTFLDYSGNHGHLITITGLTPTRPGLTYSDPTLTSDVMVDVVSTTNAVNLTPATDTESGAIGQDIRPHLSNSGELTVSLGLRLARTGAATEISDVFYLTTTHPTYGADESGQTPDGYREVLGIRLLRSGNNNLRVLVDWYDGEQVIGQRVADETFDNLIFTSPGIKVPLTFSINLSTQEFSLAVGVFGQRSGTWRDDDPFVPLPVDAELLPAVFQKNFGTFPPFEGAIGHVVLVDGFKSAPDCMRLNNARTYVPFAVAPEPALCELHGDNSDPVF